MKRSILIMVVALVCVSAYVVMNESDEVAADAGDYSGDCGTDAKYSFDPITGVLKIGGSGDMANYLSENTRPWYSYRSTIKEVQISNEITYIGDNAFYDCSELTSVTIGSSVTSFGNYAFKNCYNLTEVTIPEPVTSLGKEIFKNCTSLTKVNYNAKSASVPLINYYPFDKAGTSGTGISLIIGDSVEHIPSNVFSYCDSKITSITIGKSVKTIAKSAFVDCKYLEEIKFNAESCSDLTEWHSVFDRAGTSGSGISVVFGEGVKNIPAYLFHIRDSGSTSQSPKITSVSISDSVTTIGDYAFWSCSELTSLTIPDYVTTIGDSAFCNCTGLTSVNIPNSVTTIGNSAFHSCTGLTSVTIPNSVTTIGDYTFYYCTGLTSVNIPNSVITLGYSAFSNCTGLTSVNIPNSVTTIGDYTFYYCTELASVTIPDSVTTIGYYTFWSCTKLASVTIPDSVTTINAHAFDSCTGLTSLTLSGSITTIESYAFSGCTKLASLTIPDSVTSIENRAFNNCIGLTSVTIPSSVTTIGDGAFFGITFYNFDGITELTADAKNLAGYVFAGSEGKLVKQGDFYTISFNSDGGTAVASITKASGTIISQPANPTKTGHTFQYWTRDGSTAYSFPSLMPAESFTLTAIWKIDEYTVTYKVDGDQVGAIEKYAYGTEVTVREVYEKTGYAVTDWKADGVTVTGGKFTMGASDVVFEATSKVMTYKITFKNGTTILATYYVEHGKVPEYEGDDPTRASTVHYEYVFKGWNPEIVPATSIAEYSAEFTETVRKYTITFENDDGSIISDGTFEYGQPLTVPTATKTPTAQYEYTFKEWVNSDGKGITIPATVVGDLRAIASYDQKEREYTIVFMNSDKVYAQDELHYGAIINKPTEDPTKTSDEKFDYTFSGWDGYKDGMTVTGPATFNAIYIKTVKVTPDADGKYVVDISDDSASFTTDTITKIVDDAKSKSAATMSVSLGQGEITFDNAALQTLNGAGDLTLSRLGPGDMSSDVKSLVGGGVAYSITFGSNTDFGNGLVTVKIPYTLGAGEDPAKLKIWYIADGKVAEEKECTYADGYVTFTTNHFSLYAIKYIDPANESGFSMMIVVAILLIAVIAVASVIVVKTRKI